MDVSGFSQQESSFKLQNLAEENERLKLAVDKYTSQLSKLLGQDNSVTDLDIKKIYEEICNEIGKWIEDVEPDETKDFRERFLVKLKKGEKDLESTGLVPVPFQQDREVGLTWGKGNFSYNWMVWLSYYGTCNFVVISLVIWRYLESKLFNEYFPIGIQDDGRRQEAFFDKILTAMKAGGQGEGAAVRAINWKFETMNAMLAIPGFERRREELLNELFEGLLDELSDWISDEALDKHEDELRHKVFDPAARLHLDMRRSRRDYIMNAADVKRGLKPDKAQSWTLRSIRGWIRTSFNDVDGVFHPLFPALYRKGMDMEDDLELVKPVVIAYKTDAQRNALAVTESGPYTRVRDNPSDHLHAIKYQEPEVGPTSRRSDSKSLKPGRKGREAPGRSQTDPTSHASQSKVAKK